MTMDYGKMEIGWCIIRILRTRDEEEWKLVWFNWPYPLVGVLLEVKKKGKLLQYVDTRNTMPIAQAIGYPPALKSL